MITIFYLNPCLTGFFRFSIVPDFYFFFKVFPRSDLRRQPLAPIASKSSKCLYEYSSQKNKLSSRLLTNEIIRPGKTSKIQIFLLSYKLIRYIHGKIEMLVNCCFTVKPHPHHSFYIIFKKNKILIFYLPLSDRLVYCFCFLLN